MKKGYVATAIGIVCVVSAAAVIAVQTNRSANDIQKLTQTAKDTFRQSITYTVEEGSYDATTQGATVWVTYPDLMTIYQKEISADQNEAAVIKTMTEKMANYSKTISMQVPVSEVDGQYVPQMGSRLSELVYAEIDGIFLFALQDAELETIELEMPSMDIQ